MVLLTPWTPVAYLQVASLSGSIILTIPDKILHAHITMHVHVNNLCLWSTFRVCPSKTPIRSVASYYSTSANTMTSNWPSSGVSPLPFNWSTSPGDICYIYICSYIYIYLSVHHMLQYCMYGVASASCSFDPCWVSPSKNLHTVNLWSTGLKTDSWIWNGLISYLSLVMYVHVWWGDCLVVVYLRLYPLLIPPESCVFCCLSCVPNIYTWSVLIS